MSNRLLQAEAAITIRFPNGITLSGEALVFGVPVSYLGSVDALGNDGYIRFLPIEAGWTLEMHGLSPLVLMEEER